MTKNDDEQQDVFIDWLDAYVAGKSTPETGAASDEELLALQATVRQFHGLDEQLVQHAVFVAPRPRKWEEVVSTQPAMANAMGSPQGIFGRSGPVHGHLAPGVQWQRAASLFLIAAVIVASSIGVWRFAANLDIGGTTELPAATLPFDGGGSDGDGGMNSLAPIATATSGEESSSFPFPNADECVVDPMTQEEALQHLQAANVATEPELSIYEQGVEPSAADQQAIMQLFREWQACDQRGPSVAHMLQFETPWFTANQFPLFLKDGRPFSDQQLEEAAELATTLDRPDLAIYGLELHDEPMDKGTPPDFVPLPDGATPADSGGGGGYYQTIFADDIVIAGPDYAIARATWVNVKGEIGLFHQITWEFVKVDGEWKINAFHEPGGGGKG